MKKIVMMLFVATMFLGMAACAPKEESNNENSKDSVIHVYTRDASSGTREAFESAIGLEEGTLTMEVSEVSSNGDMATKVGMDKEAIGYVSLSTDFEANHIKPLAFEGVEASVDTVLDGSYKMQRPFNYVTRAEGDFKDETVEELVEAFIAFITESEEGLSIVEENGGIVEYENAKPWEELAKEFDVLNQDNSSITIRTCGSTSVEKIIRAALEGFSPLAGNVGFAMNQTGSSDSVKRTIGEEKDGANTAEIGFASRAFKVDEKVEEAYLSGSFCIDAVVAVVNEGNPLSDITKNSLHDIYAGIITDFANVE